MSRALAHAREPHEQGRKDGLGCEGITEGFSRFNSTSHVADGGCRGSASEKISHQVQGREQGDTVAGTAPPGCERSGPRSGVEEGCPKPVRGARRVRPGEAKRALRPRSPAATASARAGSAGIKAPLERIPMLRPKTIRVGQGSGTFTRDSSATKLGNNHGEQDSDKQDGGGETVSG